MKYWQGSRRTVGLKKGREGLGGPKPKHCKFDEYLMTLIHIKEEFDQHFLADLFGLSKSYVSKIFISWMNVLYGVMKIYLKWPSAETVRRKLPENYPKKYKDTRIILDCAELYTMRPTNCSAQAATYSLYKHHNTVQFMVGLTPTGLITFVSVYEGNTSDRHIFEKDFLYKVKPGDGIIVDRGFNVGDLLARGAKLHMPPFTRKKKQHWEKRHSNRMK